MDSTEQGLHAGETERSADCGDGASAPCRCSYGVPDQDPNLMKSLHTILCQSLLIFERIVKPFESWNNTTLAAEDEGERLI